MYRLHFVGLMLLMPGLVLAGIDNGGRFTSVPALNEYSLAALAVIMALVGFRLLRKNK